MTLYAMIVALVLAHLVADYTLQGDNVATGKNRNLDPAKFGVPWYYWMAGHAATQALLVGFICNSMLFGMIEFVLHFVIDTGKCEKKYGIHVDQALHIICKIAYVVLIGVIR